MSSQGLNNHSPTGNMTVPRTSYPVNSPALIGAIHDIVATQDLLAVPGNFAHESQFNVLEWTDSKAAIRSVSGEQECSVYIEVCLTDTHHHHHHTIYELLETDLKP